MIGELKPQQGTAALALAKGETQEEAARQADVQPASIRRWLKLPAFSSEVERLSAEILAALKAEGIANKQNRIDAYNERWAKMQTVIAERAESPDMQDVPGGATGLLVKSWKQLGGGRDAQLVPEYAVDTGLLSEMRATEKQAAVELQQWTEKREVSGDPEKPLHMKHATDFNFDTYTGLLAEVLGLGTGRLPAPATDGLSEPVDTAPSD